MKPVLTLYVEALCTACERARGALARCAELAELADIRVVDLRFHTGELPRAFVGVPTTVLHGRIVALGTPDCAELVALVRSAIGPGETE